MMLERPWPAARSVRLAAAQQALAAALAEREVLDARIKRLRFQVGQLSLVRLRQTSERLRRMVEAYRAEHPRLSLPSWMRFLVEDQAVPADPATWHGVSAVQMVRLWARAHEGQVSLRDLISAVADAGVLPHRRAEAVFRNTLPVLVRRGEFRRCRSGHYEQVVSRLADLPEVVPLPPVVDGPTASEWLALVDQTVPPALPEDVRQEVCQEIALELLEGRVAIDDLARHVPKAIQREWRRRRNFAHQVISLDVPFGNPEAPPLDERMALRHAWHGSERPR
jgi:hypothetical protein